jgi:nucleotide-binding universal stress UspA family protein
VTLSSVIEPATDWTGARSVARLDFAPDSPVQAGVSGGWALVMVAVSGSRSSQDATVLAAELARAWGARLRIVHVAAPVQYKVGRLAPMRAIPRRLVDPFDSPVLASARELVWRRGVAATLELLAGDPAEMITAAAMRAHADVLVLGAGRGGRARRRTAPTRRWIEAHATCLTLTPRTAPQAVRRLGPAAVRGRRPGRDDGLSGMVPGLREEPNE